MNSDAEFFDLDREIFDLFRDDPADRSRVRISQPEPAAAEDVGPVIEVTPDADDERRISRIVQKARFEVLVRDSVEFLFKTVGAGASELTAAMIASVSGESRESLGDADGDEAGDAESDGGAPDEAGPPRDREDL